MKKKIGIKKIAAWMLCICMLLTGMTFGESSAVQAADTTTVYFLNTGNWNSIQAYAYSNNSNSILGSWPGTALTQSSATGSNWCKIEVPVNSYTTSFNIIISENGSDSNRTTSYISGRQTAYLTTVNDVVYDSAAAAEAAMGVQQGDQTESTTVYFYNSAGWNQVYGYTYAGNTGIGDAWPGEAATQATEIGTNWWKLAVGQNAGQNPFNIIFHDGTGSVRSEVSISDSSSVYVGVSNTKYSSAEAAEAAAGTGGSGDNGGTGSGGGNSDLDYEVDLNGAGAAAVYTDYEAEDAATNAAVLEKSTAYLTDIQSEASGRAAVKLSNTGDYVEFTLQKAANAVVLRYCLPDSADGAGVGADLSLYVNGSHSQDLSLTSQYSWIYGGYPYSNSPDQGSGHRFFDETSAFFQGGTLPAGTKIRLQKDSTDTAGYYIIDFLECELVETAAVMPDGYLSITNYGAVANDGKDDYSAIASCIRDAKSQGKGVWIPEGTFDLSEKTALEVSDVTIRGAGMWYSKLYGAGASFHYSGTCKFYDFAMKGTATLRRDAEDLAGFEGTATAENVTIQNIWMEHMKVGVWSSQTANLIIQGCRIRNTYADGINLCSGTNGAVVRNNSLRNTGDDGIAIWPWQADSSNNLIAYNTVQCPTLANGIAVYGGSGNIVRYNAVYDSINNGAGICVGTDYTTASGFSGTTTVDHNVLVRCGSYHCDYKYPIGAIWIWATKSGMNASFDLTDNTLYDCSYDGVLVDCWNSISGLTIRNTNIYGAGLYGVYARGNATGSMTLENVGVAEYSSQLLLNEASGLTIATVGNGIYKTTMPQ